MDKETFKKAAEIVENNSTCIIGFETKSRFIEWEMEFDENGNLDNWSDDFHYYI